jgi:YidC/Oxa1 family membrane protein insertase
MLMWPLVKKQMHQAKAMRQLQPEIKRIKKESKGNKQAESKLLMELYKEREISPFGSIGTLIIQFIILIGLYSGLRKVVYDPKDLVTFSYSFIQHIGWMKHIAASPSSFKNTLFGLVNLDKAAISKSGLYWPAMIIVLASAVTQFFQGKQLMPSDKNAKGLREILKGAGSGKSADQSEVNAAIGRSTRYFLPVMIFLFTVSYPSALSLYWFMGGLVAYIQQSIALREDVMEMEEAPGKITSKNVADIVEAEIVEMNEDIKRKVKNSGKKSKKKRRR